MPHITLLDKASRRTYRVDSADAVVGRDPSSTIPLQGDGSAVVTSRHARFVIEEGHWWIEDLSSRNGTFHNGRRLVTGGRQRLNMGDEVSFGATGPKLKIEEVGTNGLSSTVSESRPMRAPTVAER